MASEPEPQPESDRAAKSRALDAEFVALLRGRPLWQLLIIRALVVSMVYGDMKPGGKLPPSN